MSIKKKCVEVNNPSIELMMKCIIESKLDGSSNDFKSLNTAQYVKGCRNCSF